MFAVIRTGGKQYKVAKDDVLDIERLEGDEGASVTFAEVLALGGAQPKYGTPIIEGASVGAEIVAQKRAPKVIAFMKKRRKNMHRKRGHRQQLTTVRITGIQAS
jgi:large subunit ribosomal protein L21